jgi:hypothetical protein
MVLVKNLTQSQINSITENLRGEVIANADTNRLMFNTGTAFTYLVYSDLNNAITGLSSISATNITGTLQTALQPNITTVGTLTGLDSNGIVDIKEHDGTTKGLKLAGEWITSSAEQINYTNTTPGTAEPGKALVTDSNNSIVGLTNLETDNLTVNGTLVTASAIELNYTDINTLGVAQANKALVVDANRDIKNINSIETEHITVNGTLVTASALELNTTDVAVFGTAEASKALIVDADRNIVNLNNVTASTLTGTLQTAAQPNVTSLGTLTGLNVNGAASVNSLTVAGVPLNAFNTGGLKLRVYDNVDFTGSTIKADVITSVDFTNYEPTPGLAENYSMEIWGYVKPNYSEDYTFTVNSNDNFRLWINNTLVKVAWDGGDHTNLQTDPIPLVANKWYPVYMQHVQLSGTEKFSLNWSSTSQVSQLVPGVSMAYDDKQMTVAPSGRFVQDKIVLYDGTNSTQTSLSVTGAGELLVSSHSSNVNILGHDGGSKGLKLANVLVTATAGELNYVDTTQGTAQASKALVLDADRNIANIGSIYNTGKLGVNTSGAATNQVDISSTTGDCLRLVYDNTASAADFLVSDIGDLTMKASGSTIQTHGNNSFDVFGHNGVDKGLKLAGVLVTSTAAELNYVDVAPGTATANKALVLNGDKDVTGINVIGAETVNVANLAAENFDVDTMNTTGNVGINTTSLVFGLQVNHATGDVLRLTYNDPTGDTPASKVDFKLDVNNNLQIASTGSVDIQSHNGTDKGLKLAGVLVTSTAAELNYVDTTPGTAQASKALVMDADLSIVGISALSATSITGVLQTAAQPNVTTVGTLTGLSVQNVLNVVDHDGVDKGLQLAGVLVTSTAAELNYVDTTPGTAQESKALVVDANKAIAGVGNMTTVGRLGVNTTTPGAQVEINSATGECLRLTYDDADGEAETHADLTMDNAGILTLKTTGASVAVDGLNSFNVVGHNGTNKGLQLAGVLVTATAAELNYVDTTPGSGEASKALVLNGDKEIAGIQQVTTNIASITTASVTGTTESVSPATGSLVTVGGVGIGKNLNVGGTASIQGNASFQANVQVAGPALVIPVGNTAARPDGAAGQIRYNSETSQFEGFGAGNSWGSLGGVTDVDQDTKILAETAAGADDDNLRFINFGSETMRLTKTNRMGLGTTNPDKKLEINSATGDNLRLTYDAAAGGADNFADLLMSETGVLTIQASGGQVDIHADDDLDVKGHNGVAKGLKLGGVLLTATASELNILDGATLSTAELNLLDGVTATTIELNYVDTTPGTAEATKALVVDADTSIAGINSLTATNITGTLQTAAQPNVTTVGTLTGLSVQNVLNVVDHNGTNKGLQLAGTLVTATAAELNYVDTTPGTVEASKAMVVDADRNISNLGSLSTTGKLAVNSTAAVKQVDISSATGDCLRLLYNGTTNVADFLVSDSGNLTMKASGSTITAHGDNSLDVAGHNGVDKGLKLAGVLVTSTAAELNYVDVAPGTATASKALVLNGDKDVTGINVLGAETINVGTLAADNFEVETMNTTGNVGINTTSLVFGLQVNHATGDVLRLTYNDPTGDAPASKVDFKLDGSNNLQIASTGSVDIQSHNGVNTGLKLAGVLVTSTAAELNYVDTTPGTAQPSKALVVNEDKDVVGINALSATSLTGTLQTPSQPNITTVGTLTGLSTENVLNVIDHNGVDKGLQLAGALVTATAAEINYVDTTPGTAQASKALVVDANKNISGINSITMNTLALTFDNAVGNTTGVPLVITRTTTSPPAVGLGVGMSFVVENDANANVEFGNAAVVATSVTTAAESGQYVINLMNNGSLVEAMRLDANNLYTTQLFETSDRRVKENFNQVSLEETHQRIMNLSLVDYNYKGQSRTHRGLIAQEVKEVIPAAVDIQERNGIEDFHSVSTREVTNHLIGSVQYLSKKLEEALEKIAKLEAAAKQA